MNENNMAFYKDQMTKRPRIVMKTSELLRKAKAALLEMGWTKNTARDEWGRHCAVGAVLLFDAETKTQAEARDFLCTACPGVEDDIVRFNDRRTTTFNDIMDVFDRAEKLALIDEEGV
jgi:hypothetical protein